MLTTHSDQFTGPSIFAGADAANVAATPRGIFKQAVRGDVPPCYRFEPFMASTISTVSTDTRVTRAVRSATFSLWSAKR